MIFQHYAFINIALKPALNVCYVCIEFALQLHYVYIMKALFLFYESFIYVLVLHYLHKKLELYFIVSV
jgi:hypothetical protein